MMIPQTKQIGPGSLATIGGLVARLNPKTVMLVTGGDSYSRSGAHGLVEPALANLPVSRLSGVTANPKIADVERGVSLWKTKRPQIIIAVGGGSVLDVAKLIGLLGPNAAPWTAFGGSSAGLNRLQVPVIAIPTTAGSGAEATRFATFYVADKKQSISHPHLRPTHAIVDSLLTTSLPIEVAAVTCLDALAQAIESMWAVGATPASQRFADAAIREILPCLKQVVRAPTPKLRERMAAGAHLAGQAIDISRTTAAHALSYALTADLHVPHGYAVALLLPSIIRINSRRDGRMIQDPRGPAYIAKTMERILGLLDCRHGEEAACFIQQTVADLGLANRLYIRAGHVSPASLAGKVNADRLSNNPVEISAADILRVYTDIIGINASSGRGSP